MTISLWGIEGIIDIALTGFQGNNEEGKTHFIVDLAAFKDRIDKASVRTGATPTRPPCIKDCNGAHDDYRPVSGYGIETTDVEKFHRSLGRDQTARHDTDQNITWDGKRWDGQSVSSKCTPFYKLFWRDFSYIKDKGFRRFDPDMALEASPKHWLNVNLKDTTYDGFLMIWYRTADSYIESNKCREILNYRKDPTCKSLMDGNDKYDMHIAEYCAGLPSSNELLFSNECNDAYMGNRKQSEISKKRVNYCLDYKKLKTNDNCKALAYRSDPPGILAEHKYILDKYVRDNLCNDSMSQTDEELLKFCSCIVEPRPAMKILDAQTKIELAPRCYNATCPTQGYHTASHETNCPMTFCSQDMNLQNLLEANNIQMSCGGNASSSSVANTTQQPATKEKTTTTTSSAPQPDNKEKPTTTTPPAPQPTTTVPVGKAVSIGGFDTTQTALAVLAFLFCVLLAFFISNSQQRRQFRPNRNYPQRRMQRPQQSNLQPQPGIPSFQQMQQPFQPVMQQPFQPVMPQPFQPVMQQPFQPVMPQNQSMQPPPH